MSYFRHEFLLILEENLGKMDVSHGVLDVAVSEIVLNVERVSGAPCFHSSSEVPEGLEAYLQKPWILELKGYSFALLCKVSAVVIQGHAGS